MGSKNGPPRKLLDRTVHRTFTLRLRAECDNETKLMSARYPEPYCISIYLG